MHHDAVHDEGAEPGVGDWTVQTIFLLSKPRGWMGSVSERLEKPKPNGGYNPFLQALVDLAGKMKLITRQLVDYKSIAIYNCGGSISHTQIV